MIMHKQSEHNFKVQIINFKLNLIIFKIKTVNHSIKIKNLKLKILLSLLSIVVCLVSNAPFSMAQSTPPSSGNYKLLDFGFGAGGTATSSSPNYSLFGTLGQVDQGSPSSANYFLGAGLEYTLQASVAAVPTFTNPSNWYNKLHLVINKGGKDPQDTEYAIRIASGSGQFQYVQNDNTVGDSLRNEDWQTYSSWGGGAGINIIGLYPGTTYTVQVAARQGQFFTQFLWSPAATASTDNSSLSFDIDVSPTDQSTNPPYTLAIGQLSPGTITTANDKIWVSLTTNATNGGLIYIEGTNTGLLSSTVSHTISAVSNDLTSVSEGYGAQNNSATQTSGGPMEAVSPYDQTGNTVGILDTAKRTIYDSSGAPVTSGRVSFQIKAKASNTTPSANDYADVITVLATGSF
jgi:hypothetical protein